MNVHAGKNKNCKKKTNNTSQYFIILLFLIDLRLSNFGLLISSSTDYTYYIPYFFFNFVVL